LCSEGHCPKLVDHHRFFRFHFYLAHQIDDITIPIGSDSCPDPYLNYLFIQGMCPLYASGKALSSVLKVREKSIGCHQVTKIKAPYLETPLAANDVVLGVNQLLFDYTLLYLLCQVYRVEAEHIRVRTDMQSFQTDLFKLVVHPDVGFFEYPQLFRC
jgi:hypothetical protein